MGQALAVLQRVVSTEREEGSASTMAWESQVTALEAEVAEVTRERDLARNGLVEALARADADAARAKQAEDAAVSVDATAVALLEAEAEAAKESQATAVAQAVAQAEAKGGEALSQVEASLEAGAVALHTELAREIEEKQQALAGAVVSEIAHLKTIATQNSELKTLQAEVTGLYAEAEDLQAQVEVQRVEKEKAQQALAFTTAAGATGVAAAEAQAKAAALGKAADSARAELAALKEMEGVQVCGPPIIHLLTTNYRPVDHQLLTIHPSIRPPNHLYSVLTHSAPQPTYS